MIKILAAIYGILSLDANVSAIVGDKIFPNVVPDSDGGGQVLYPLIVMNRLELTPTYAKQGCVQDTVNVEILCYDKSYFRAVELADHVRNAIEFVTGDYDGFSITKSRLVTIDEAFADPVYLQRLIFTIK